MIVYKILNNPKLKGKFRIIMCFLKLFKRAINYEIQLVILKVLIKEFIVCGALPLPKCVMIILDKL